MSNQSKIKFTIFLSLLGLLTTKTSLVYANSQYTATGRNLVTGTQVTSDVNNTGSETGTYGNDGNYWTVARVNPNGLNAQLQFDGVREQGANKLIITLEDSNITTADAFSHQICDWVSTTDVDNAADAQCTGGGWRTLQPRKTAHTSTADTTRNYEIYDGYFWDTTSAPGTVVSTPISNFIESSNQRVLIRFYSTVNSTTSFRIDQAMVEVAIDPIYEPALFTKTAGGTVTGNITDLIGASSTGVNDSDNTRVTIPQPGSSQATDIYFTFNNVKKYTGMNTFVVIPEVNVSNVEWGEIGAELIRLAQKEFSMLV